jgi:hypothetical protein
MSISTAPVLEKSVITQLAPDRGTITMRVVVFKKKAKKDQDEKKAKAEESPIDIDDEEDFSTGSSEVNTYLEQPKRGRMCIVFALNGQRHDGLDNSFIVNELKMKYL